MEIMRQLATFAGYGISILGLLTAICKPIRSFFVRLVNGCRKDNENKLDVISEQLADITTELKNQRDKDKIQQDALRCVLRNTLTHLYYKYKIDNIPLPPYERENINFLYEAYTSLDGNSYVRQCYEELM